MNARTTTEAEALLWIEKRLAEAQNWICECGQRCNPMRDDWRWNGFSWEHHHGYPLGYVAATRRSEPTQDGIRVLQGRPAGQ